MKVIYKASDKIQFELEASGQKELFKELATVEEIFGEGKCGLCSKSNIKFVVRTVEDNDYHELRCNDCGAILSFGQHKKGGTLFPKRKDEDGNYMKSGGWYKYSGKNNKE